MRGIMMAFPDWLHELAEGPIRTQWGGMMKAEYPPAEVDKVYFRLKAAYGDEYEWAIQGFVTVAPMLAEAEAIQAFKEAHPERLWQFQAIAPEILTPEEALCWAEADLQPVTLTEKDRKLLLHLLTHDPSMKPLHGA